MNTFHRFDRQLTAMGFIDGHVLFFADASESTATNTFTIGIHTGTSARDAEIAEIVLG
jgi:hypothetical protein